MAIMTYQGHIENGRIILDHAVVLPEGARVNVQLVPSSSESEVPVPRLRELFGSIRSGNLRSADNERIDADLARAYQEGA